MGFLIQYVADFAPWIYLVCGGTALIQLYRAWQVRVERRQAVFSLEREKAMGDLYKIFLTAVVLLVVMGSTYFVSTTLADAVEAVVSETLDPTAPVLSVPTLTATPLPATPTPTVTPSPPPVQVQAPEPAVVIQPTDTPVPTVTQPVCPDARAVILSPGSGQTVSGMVSIQGTAVHEDFWYYKLEFAPGDGSSGNFAWFDGGENQVRAGYLGSFNSSAVANGTYTIRVVSVDSSGNFPPPCLVSINVEN